MPKILKNIFSDLSTSFRLKKWWKECLNAPQLMKYNLFEKINSWGNQTIPKHAQKPHNEPGKCWNLIIGALTLGQNQNNHKIMIFTVWNSERHYLL